MKLTARDNAEGTTAIVFISVSQHIVMTSERRQAYCVARIKREKYLKVR